MPRLTPSLALWACLAAAPLWAADADGNFAVDGAGRAPCSDLVKAIKDQDGQSIATFAGWIDGFLTAMNVNQDDTFDLTPWQTTTLSISKMNAFCEANPDMALVNALGRYMNTLMPVRLTQGADLVRVENEGRAVFLYPDVLTRMADALLAAGYSLPDGDFGPGHAATLRAFQTDRGLTPSGLPDQATLNALFPQG